jgi:hypothetical protein
MLPETGQRGILKTRTARLPRFQLSAVKRAKGL